MNFQYGTPMSPATKYVTARRPGTKRAAMMNFAPCLSKAWMVRCTFSPGMWRPRRVSSSFSPKDWPARKMMLSPTRMPTRPVMIISGSEPSRPTSQPPVMSGMSSGSGTPRPQVMRTKSTPTYAAGPWKFVRKWNSQLFRPHPVAGTLVSEYARAEGSASSALALADLPDQELAQRPLRFAQALGQVLRQGERELERRARVRGLHLLEGGLGQLDQLDVGGG